VFFIYYVTTFAESSSSRSSGLLAPPQLQGEQNAYIPYIYAKDCIQRVGLDCTKVDIILLSQSANKSLLKRIFKESLRNKICYFVGYKIDQILFFVTPLFLTFLPWLLY